MPEKRRKEAGNSGDHEPGVKDGLNMGGLMINMLQAICKTWQAGIACGWDAKP
jgi:hypothetical protein